MRIPLTALIIAGGVAVSGCAYGSYGRYGGVSVGYGSGYGSYGYDPWYGYGGSRFGSPYWGWYDDFYYPGTGFYVYDRWRRPFFWNDRYRRYWTDRRDRWRQRSGRDPSLQQAVWSAFERRRANRNVTVRSDDGASSSSTTTRVRRSESRRADPVTTPSERRRIRRAPRADR